MSRVATAELGLAPATVADNNGGDFDVFSSLRSGTESEVLSSGIGGQESNGVFGASDDFDLGAVASGEVELDISMNGSVDSKNVLAPVDTLSLAGKSEISSSENRMNDERRAAICQGVASAACASCAARDDCPILRMRNFASENLQPAPERESYIGDLLSDDDDGVVVAGYANPNDSEADSINTGIAEASDNEAGKSTESVALPNQGDEIPISETAKFLDEHADIEETKQLFFESATTLGGIIDDADEIERYQSESVSEVPGDTSDEEYFTEPTEENRPSIEIKQQTPAVISDAVDKESEQPASESSGISTQTETVPSSPAVSEDAQTVNENNTLPKYEIVNSLPGENEPVSVIEDTYDDNGSDYTATVSGIKPLSTGCQKGNSSITTETKSSNSVSTQVAESSFTLVSNQHLATQFNIAKADGSIITEPVDNSNVKPSESTQRSEVRLEAGTTYDDFTQSSDYIEDKQPEDLVLDVSSTPSPQERMTTASVPAKYDENETDQSPDVYSIDQSGKTPQVDKELAVIQAMDYSFSEAEEVINNEQKIINAERYESAVDAHQSQTVSSQTQIPVENSEDSLAIGDYVNSDYNLVQPKIDDVETDLFVADEAVNAASKIDVSAKVEMKDTILPAKQFDHDDAVVERRCYDEDEGVWAEEGAVFFVEQQELSAVEPEVPSAEAVALRKETDDLPSVDDGVDMDSVEQLDNSKAASVPEITNDDYEPEGQVVIPALPAIEPISDVELDEPAVKISEERIMPREEYDSIVMEASEKSDLPRVDDEVEAIITDTSDVEPAIDLLEAQEELAVTEVSEAVESELDEQNDLVVDGVVDDYSYDSEASAVSDNVLVVKSRPSSGLWPDDNRLNPEEESASTVQSSADDTSLVSRLVGMFVVAMCVVRGRQSVKV